MIRSGTHHVHLYIRRRPSVPEARAARHREGVCGARALCVIAANLIRLGTLLNPAIDAAETANGPEV